MAGWKEQMATVSVPGEGLVLEAVWQAGSGRGAVIAPPHPVHGGSLENPVCNELAYGLWRAGWASLRFNWRGVGASQGRISGDASAAEADYRAALESLALSFAPPILAAGYSFGAATALRVALSDKRVGPLVLVAPPVAMLADLDLDKLRGPVHVIVGGRDEFAAAEQLAHLLEPLPHAQLDVIPRVDHFFSASGIAELGELVRQAGQRCAEHRV
jgi:alpha/beta superfamily hydrolase